MPTARGRTTSPVRRPTISINAAARTDAQRRRGVGRCGGRSRRPAGRGDRRWHGAPPRGRSGVPRGDTALARPAVAAVQRRASATRCSAALRARGHAARCSDGRRRRSSAPATRPTSCSPARRTRQPPRAPGGGGEEDRAAAGERARVESAAAWGHEQATGGRRASRPADGARVREPRAVAGEAEAPPPRPSETEPAPRGTRRRNALARGHGGRRRPPVAAAATAPRDAEAGRPPPSRCRRHQALTERRV